MEACLEAQQKLFSGEAKAPLQERSTEWSSAFVSNLQEQTEAEHSCLGNGKGQTTCLWGTVSHEDQGPVSGSEEGEATTESSRHHCSSGYC